MNYVAIPVGNRYSLLMKLLNSLDPLESIGWQIIIGIDYPYDPTIEHVFKRRDPLLTIWNKSHYGIGWNHYRVMNYAFSKLKAETVCLLDADLELLPDGVQLLDWFTYREDFLGMSLLAPRFPVGYKPSKNNLVSCNFFSRFQLTCKADMWYSHIQPCWMRTGRWDEDFSDLTEVSGRKVVHPEMSRVRVNGTQNSQMLSMEQHALLLNGMEVYEASPVLCYKLSEAEAERR